MKGLKSNLLRPGIRLIYAGGGGGGGGGVLSAGLHLRDASLSVLDFLSSLGPKLALELRQNKHKEHKEVTSAPA